MKCGAKGLSHIGESTRKEETKHQSGAVLKSLHKDCRIHPMEMARASSCPPLLLPSNISWGSFVFLYFFLKLPSVRPSLYHVWSKFLCLPNLLPNQNKIYVSLPIEKTVEKWEKLLITLCVCTFIFEGQLFAFDRSTGSAAEVATFQAIFPKAEVLLFCNGKISRFVGIMS